jgi:ABC-type polysaccharide/polyol phosphate transport system ATPase subunit
MRVPMPPAATGADTDVVVRVEGLGKRYVIGAAPGTETLYERLGGLLSGHRSGAERSPAIWALKDVSFTVKQGEVGPCSAPTGRARAR